MRISSGVFVTVAVFAFLVAHAECAPVVRAGDGTGTHADARIPIGLPAVDHIYSPDNGHLSSALWWVRSPGVVSLANYINLSDGIVYTVLEYPAGSIVPVCGEDLLYEKYDLLLQRVPGSGMYRTRTDVFVGYRFDPASAAVPAEPKTEAENERRLRVSDWVFVYARGYLKPNLLARKGYNSEIRSLAKFLRRRKERPALAELIF